MRLARIVFNLFIVSAFAAGLLGFPAPVHAAGTTITVTSTADDATVANLNSNGSCDLREAVQAANTNLVVGECPAGSGTEKDTIAFNIPGSGVHMISLVAFLGIEDDVLLDGTTQPGYAGSPLIRLDGADIVGYGLDVSMAAASYSTIKGLMFTGFLYGSLSISADYITVQGNYIGTDGISDLTTGTRGIMLVSAEYAQIGGPNAGDRNVIAGHEYDDVDMWSNADHNTIEGNYIGVSADGTTAIPVAGSVGVSFSQTSTNGAAFNTVKNNVIAGHSYGIIAYSSDDGNNTIQGNFIGTDASGTVALGNTTGIGLTAGTGNTITDNLISGNATGIAVSNTAAGTVIRGNKIGTDVSGMSALPNAAYGIWLNNVPANIGDGVTPGNNIISGNAMAGIYLLNSGTTGTTIVGNKIGPNLAGSASLANGGNTLEGGIVITNFASPQIAQNWIAGNSTSGVYFHLTGTLAAGSTGNCFTDNADFGAKNSNTSVTVPLSGNWWGDPSGPFHAANYPAGLGQPVSDFVDASSFLTAAPVACSPVVSTSSPSLNFGSQLAGSSATRQLTLTNTGGALMNITGMSTAAPFSIDASSTCPPGGGTLASGASCTVVVRFQPSAAGAASGSLVITSDAASSPDPIGLEGTGVTGTQLLKNTSFENDANLDNKPDGWSYTGFAPATDRRDCTIFKSGSCSLKLVGNNQLKTVSRTILQSGSAGDDFTFSLWSRASAVPSGSIYKVQVQFYDGATLVATRTKNFTTGTHTFQKAAGSFTAPAAYTKVIYKISFKAASGAVWFDAASLKWAP